MLIWSGVLQCDAVPDSLAPLQGGRGVGVGGGEGVSFDMINAEIARNMAGVLAHAQPLGGGGGGRRAGLPDLIAAMVPHPDYKLLSVK